MKRTASQRLKHSVAQLYSAGECQVDPRERENCGVPRISRKDCEDKGCCFDGSVRGSIWCFYTKTGKARREIVMVSVFLPIINQSKL